MFSSLFITSLMFGYAFICWKTGRFYGSVSNDVSERSSNGPFTKENNPKAFKYAIIAMLVVGTFFLIAPLLIKIGLLPNIFEEY